MGFMPSQVDQTNNHYLSFTLRSHDLQRAPDIRSTVPGRHQERPQHQYNRLRRMEPPDSSPIPSEAFSSDQPREPPDELDKLTIGIEVEFLLIRPVTDGEDSGGNEEGLRIVREALSASRFSQPCTTCSDVHEYRLPLSDTDDDPKMIAQCWTVTHDFTVGIPFPERQKLGDHYRCHGIEIKSRALYYDEPTPSEDNNRHGKKAAHMWDLEHETVLNVVDDLGKREGFRVFVNSTSGFHVHVGNGKKGINTRVARGLLGLFTAFEPQFDSINTTQRIGGGGGFDKGYPRLPDPPGEIRFFDYESENHSIVQENMGFFCKPMSSIHISNAEDPDTKGPLGHRLDVGSWLTLIRQRTLAPALKKLAGRFSSWHCTVVNLERIWDGGSYDDDEERDEIEDYRTKPTIEFRSHAGTLNYQEQVSWINVVALLTKFCYAHREKDVFASLNNSWRRYDYSFNTLLKDIGADKKTRNHYRRVLHEGEGSWANIRSKQQKFLESRRFDDIRRTDIINAAAEQELKYRDLAAVRQKMRSKFQQGLYGQFPEDVVKRWLEETGDYGAYERGEAEHLILRE